MACHVQDPKVKIALSLYKVQQNIYLLDFQRVEVGVFVYAIFWVLISLSVFYFVILL
jgi:hypothetical protein